MMIMYYDILWALAATNVHWILILVFQEQERINMYEHLFEHDATVPESRWNIISGYSPVLMYMNECSVVLLLL